MIKTVHHMVKNKTLAFHDAPVTIYYWCGMSETVPKDEVNNDKSDSKTMRRCKRCVASRDKFAAENSF